LQKQFHVKRIGLFGSFARQEETPTSDIDLLVEFSEPIGLKFVEMKHYLEKELQRPVDLVTMRALKPQLKERILREVIFD
ncbi:MAG TPA: nucleotidyltransferase family protein, partial [Patescibacteria group bacterium]|nr:nucleotidyltransferase family protein [Patescibacteria group bacterium]